MSTLERSVLKSVIRVCLSSVVGWDTVAWAEGDTYMRVDGRALYPGIECTPLPQINSNGVHRDEIGEIVSNILLKGFRKLQITRHFSIPLS